MYRSLLVLLSIIIFPALGFAQEQENESSTQVEVPETATDEAVPLATPLAQGVEKIEVTGSHIKRINIEGPSPVLTLDREYLQRSGYNSVADVLRDSTLTATGVGREAAGGQTPGTGGSSGAAVTGLRGFGPDKILVLLNGQRLPKIGGGNAVDLNLIPFQAVERVEILKDGASATYGSDALAGVINFITKKDFDGSSVTMRYSSPEEPGGRRTDIAAVYGKNFSKGNILAIYQYRSNQELFDRDRDFSRGGLSPTGSPGSFRPADDVIKDGGADDDDFQPDPNCPPGQVRPFPGGNHCSFDFTPYSWSLPAIEQHSAILNGEYEINESLKFFSNLLYTQRMARWQFAPAPDTFADDRNPDGSGTNYEIPDSVAGSGGWGLDTGGEPIDVRYRLVDELGPRSNRDTTDSYGGTIGLKGYMFDSWEWDYTITHGASNVHNDGHSGYANKRTLYNLMTSNQFNPFSTTRQNVDPAKHRSEQWIDSDLTMTQLKAFGELASFGGGILSAAAGVSGAWESYQVEVDAVTEAGDLFGGSGESGQGSRSYQSFFTELGYSMQQWEFQLAGRMDRYSDFGETFNPKFAFRYTPIKQLMFRGSVGTGFKAPTLEELYSAQSYGFPFFTDLTACNAAKQNGDPDAIEIACGDQQYRTLQGGNPDLREETSFSYNLGTLFQPTRDLSFGLDYWFTEINDAIGIDLNGLMLAEQQLGPGGLPSGVSVNRNGAGQINFVNAPLVNLSKQQAQGLDFAFDYNFRLGGLTFRPHMDHSQFLSYREQPIPGLPVQEKIDWAGRPRWRNTSYLSVGFLQDHNVRFTARTIAGQFKNRHTSDQTDKRRTANYTEYDLNYQYTAFWNGQISFGVKNLFGTDRPLDDTAGFNNRLNASLYDQLGRLYYLGYTQNF